MRDDKYLVFYDYPGAPLSRTRIVYVNARRTGDLLGCIRWHGAWRRYCFFPHVDTVFSAGCARTIADYIEAMRKKPAKPGPRRGMVG